MYSYNSKLALQNMFFYFLFLFVLELYCCHLVVEPIGSYYILQIQNQLLAILFMKQYLKQFTKEINIIIKLIRILIYIYRLMNFLIFILRVIVLHLLVVVFRTLNSLYKRWQTIFYCISCIISKTP
jgi:hypothetical protein